MARSSSFQVTLQAAGRYVSTHLDGQLTVHDWSTGKVSLSDSSGVGAGQSNRVWVAGPRTLLSGASFVVDFTDLTPLDLGTGVGQDALGLNESFDQITLFAVRNRKTSAGTLRISPDATNGWVSLLNAAAQLSLPPGSEKVIYTQKNPAYAVSSTNKRLKFEAVSGDVTYDLFLAGKDA